MNGHTLVVEQLIAAGAAALDVQNNAGYGPCADCNGLTLCKMGSRLLGRSTAVILAASNGHMPVVDKLIAAGAALNVKFNEGYVGRGRASPGWLLASPLQDRPRPGPLADRSVQGSVIQAITTAPQGLPTVPATVAALPMRAPGPGPGVAPAGRASWH
jgi:hypothetical protein